jgi:pimeloyl-ACP methyl ester carboxylesterase
MRTSSSERTGIHYVTRGEADAPLVICLHGFPDIPRTWDQLSERLAGRGFRVVTPFLPGYAPSSAGAALDLSSAIRKISTFIEELSPEAPVRVVGHDWGAVIAHVLLAQRPARVRAAAVLSVPHPLALERNVVDYPRQLLRSSYMVLFQVPVVAAGLIRARDFTFVKWLWHVWSPGFDPGTDYFHEVTRCLDASLPAPLEYYRSLRSPKIIRELRSLLRVDPIPVPTLYLHGERDGCIGVDLIDGQERYHGALFETVRLAEAGHFLHLERPDQTNQLIDDWFQSH